MEAIFFATTHRSRALSQGSIVPTRIGTAARHWHLVSKPYWPVYDDLLTVPSKNSMQPVS